MSTPEAKDMSKMNGDELETYNTGLPPLHIVLDPLRAAQEKVKRRHLYDPHYNDGLADAESEGERYHGLYAPPKIPVKYWLAIRGYLEPLRPYRTRLARWIQHQSFRLMRLSERVQNAW